MEQEKNNHAPKQNPRKPAPQEKHDGCKRHFLRPFFGHCAHRTAARAFLQNRFICVEGMRFIIFFRCRTIVQRGVVVTGRVCGSFCFPSIQKENLSTCSGHCATTLMIRRKGTGCARLWNIYFGIFLEFLYTSGWFFAL